MALPTISLQNVYQARKAIRPFCMRTPLVPSAELSAISGGSVSLKLESMQPVGSFKVRGAANKILQLNPEDRERGVITASTGNHGRAVAYVATQLGIPVTVCMSEEVPANKVAAIKKLGAEVVISGASQDEAFLKLLDYQHRYQKTLVHPFDDLQVIAGQATIGVELVEEAPSLDIVLVPLSGGGLISGIAFALKSVNRSIQVIGVSMERGPVMYHSLRAGKPIQMPEKETLADSLRGGIGLENRYTFQMVQDYVDDVILVGEDEIARAMAFALLEHQLVLEGAGAVGIAALLSQKVPGSGKEIAVVLSGKNVQVPTFIKTVQPYLVEEGTS